MSDLLESLKNERGGYIDLISASPANSGELKQYDRGMLAGMEHMIEIVEGYYDKNND